MYLIKAPQTYQAPRESGYISAVLSITEERASTSKTEKMPRLTQRVSVSPEYLLLPPCHGGCDKISWLPEGKVFSNVQREKIISKFFKESILKKVFRSQQMRWEGSDDQKGTSSYTFPGTRKILRKQSSSYNKMGRRNENCANSLRVSNISQENKLLQSSTHLPHFPRGALRNVWNRNTQLLLVHLPFDFWLSFEYFLSVSPHLEARMSSGLVSAEYKNLSHWNLDSEVPVPENKNLPAGRDRAAGGKINKKYLEIPVEQLMPEPNLSAHTQESTQNSKQGIFQLWNCPLNEGSTIEKREFKKSSVETGFNVTTNPIRVFTLSHPFTSTSADEQVGPYPGLLVPLGLCWPHADGDFFKNRNEIQFSSYSTIENNDGETLPAPNWNLKHGSSSVEENLTDESDLSENEKANDTLLSSFKKVDLNLKPETIKNVEEPFTEEPNEVFPYPDFLPPAFSTLDLHNLALSKSDHWKATLEPAESSVEQLITRLLELERLQHMTIQKERPRLPTTFCTPAVTERPSSSKATPKARQPKLCASLSLQIPCVDKSQEKSKNNSGSCKLEQNTLKWNWSNAGKYKWNTRPPSLKSSSITKQLIETYDKNPKSSILNPCQELSSKPTTGQTTQPPVKMVSTRCLPSRSPVPVSPIPLSFPENQKEEIKAPKRNFGTKKKLYRQNTVWNRPFSIQKLNCLSPSLIAKDKCCSPIEQK
ncbi:PREDICTED: protein FAM217A isoform X5 [Rhinopithecus bieti]|uniref:protein FAM217A isoform X5 n=1 Tax=Rhinopithecus bieti TaxID=61621 RepID=UPI00083BF315|nr:PREDICTED: protein FAM217A isoform X5 [Rhinopithecus bieti]